MWGCDLTSEVAEQYPARVEVKVPGFGEELILCNPSALSLSGLWTYGLWGFSVLRILWMKRLSDGPRSRTAKCPPHNSTAMWGRTRRLMDCPVQLVSWPALGFSVENNCEQCYQSLCCSPKACSLRQVLLPFRFHCSGDLEMKGRVHRQPVVMDFRTTGGRFGPFPLSLHLD